MLRNLGALVLVAAAVALAAFGPLTSKKSARTLASIPSIDHGISADRPDMSWPMLVPEQAPRASDRKALRPERTPEPDWKGMSLAIADAGVRATPTGQMLPVEGVADLSIAMSNDERRALIAQAREPASGVAPRGFMPGIVVITAGGGGSDGICR